MSRYIAPPREASPDRLLHLCEVLDEDIMEKKALAEQAKGGKDAIYDTVRYGERMGFLRVSDQGVSNTFLGRKAGEDLSDHSRQLLFQIGLSFYTFYVDLLNRVVDVNDLPDRIDRSVLIGILRQEFGLEMSEKTTKERVHKFMRILEEAGFGEFQPGNAHQMTGFEFGPEADRLVPEVVSASALDLVSGQPDLDIKKGPVSSSAPLPPKQVPWQQTTLSSETEGSRTIDANDGEDEKDNTNDKSNDGDDSGESRELFFTDN